MGAGDYVTEIDRQSEAAITRLLERETPHIPVVGEEEGGREGERYWVVDPLDGTTNFMHGFPIVGVSVALVERNRPVVGAVHAPFLQETYLGARGLGARRRGGVGQGSALSVSARSPGEAVVATAFPFRDKALAPRYLPVFERAFGRFEDLRRAGAAALDLAWVAAGVFDGFFELGLSAWDVAAGAVLIERRAAW
jgi:myo-inositol-1(or 4)-monophosphatase